MYLTFVSVRNNELRLIAPDGISRGRRMFLVRLLFHGPVT